VPAGWRLHPEVALLRARDGAVLLGGAPLRVLALSAAGARLVGGWWRGEPVGVGEADRALARRLLDAGLAQPEPAGGPDADELTVIVPVRDRTDQLRRCLAALGTVRRVVVVDDGSTDPAAISAVARAAGATCLRLDASSGPAAARNAGLAVVETEFVAFVDSDCVVGQGFPERLLAHLGDPAVAMAAPRIVALAPSRGLLGAFETHHSALDMGGRAGLVRPGTAIAYVPSAALIARRSALGDGFDAGLHVGEDVDLVWRLHRAGWQVRYVPSVAVAHDHRVHARAWFARRVAYDSSAAPLNRRHPGRVPAVSISRMGLAFWGAVLTGNPLVAAAVSALGTAALRRRLRARVPRAGRAAAKLVLTGQLTEGRFLARAFAAPWLPLLLWLTAVRSPLARRLWLLIGAGAAWEWAQERHEPTPLHYAAPRAAADLARCVGVWAGAWRARSLRALLPHIR
jgi:mycofactocin system glycosyltransferase